MSLPDSPAADEAVRSEHAGPAILVESLTKTFGSFTAVRGLSMDVGRGEIVGLLGPNGAGKTTTMRMLIGVLSPTSGSARIAGHDCFAERHVVMESTGYLPDEPAFAGYLRGSELIRFCGRMHGLSSEQIRVRAGHLVARMKLDDALEEYAINYSKGMRKKLALVCALLHEPSVLIVDEPTNGLDPLATRELHALFRSLAADGTAVLFSTHLLDQAERLSDRVAILVDGALAAFGPLDALRERSAPGGSLEDVFFRVTSGETEDPAAERAGE